MGWSWLSFFMLLHQVNSSFTKSENQILKIASFGLQIWISVLTWAEWILWMFWNFSLFYSHTVYVDYQSKETVMNWWIHQRHCTYRWSICSMCYFLNNSHFCMIRYNASRLFSFRCCFKTVVSNLSLQVNLQIAPLTLMCMKTLRVSWRIVIKGTRWDTMIYSYQVSIICGERWPE